jgi:hypothetical protein
LSDRNENSVQKSHLQPPTPTPRATLFLVQNSDFSTSLFPFFYACRKSTAPNGQESQRREQQLTEIPNRAPTDMLLLKSMTSHDRSMVPPPLKRDAEDSHLSSPSSCLYFHCASRVFNTLILAYMLDSLVRVTRRVDENHFVSITNTRLLLPSPGAHPAPPDTSILLSRTKG